MAVGMTLFPLRLRLLDLASRFCEVGNAFFGVVSIRCATSFARRSASSSLNRSSSGMSQKPFPRGSLTRITDDSTQFWHGHTSSGCADIMMLIGVLSTDWNFCEARFAHFLGRFLGDQFFGANVAHQLGNQTKGDILSAAVKRFEKNSKAKKSVLFMVEAFSKIREIRNAVVHSHHVFESPKRRTICFNRISQSGSAVEMIVTRKKLAELSESVYRLREFILDMEGFYFGRHHKPRKSLPRIFPLPDIRTRPRPVARRGQKLRRKPLPKKLSSAQKRALREKGGAP
jgi:hypothetical protein